MNERDATEAAWRDYVAAAQRLDAVRRGIANHAAEQQRARTAARDELAAVRARLAPQNARLREWGVPEDRLAPTPTEAAAAAQAVGGEPVTALAALHQARLTADAADAAVLSPRGVPGGAPPWLRNLLVYVPFAVVVFVVQLALYLTADGSTLAAAAVVCGLTMPAAAFALGWVVTGLVFPRGPRGRVERTPLVGAAVSFAPVLVACAIAGMLALLR
jgi:hypothetical protein